MRGGEVFAVEPGCICRFCGVKTFAYILCSNASLSDQKNVDKAVCVSLLLNLRNFSRTLFWVVVSLCVRKGSEPLSSSP
jgi:hypothetical protein